MNMNPSSGNLSVWMGDQSACVRISGRANFTTSIDFKKLMQHFRDTGRSRVVLDLSQCLLMDSTFLGVLANEGQKRAVSLNGQIIPGIELVNPNQRVRDLIDNLGVSHLFQQVQCAASTENFEPVQPAEGVSREEITRMREACAIAAQVLAALQPLVRPGITTQDLDEAGRDAMKRLGARSACYGYQHNARRYPAHTCISVNSSTATSIP